MRSHLETEASRGELLPSFTVLHASRLATRIHGSLELYGSLELKDGINDLGEHLGHYVIAFALGNIVMIILEPVGREGF
jgi:hypothetical protein